MNFTYEELRRMFENGKVEAKKSIAAYLIQESSVSNPKTAKQISDALNIPVQSVINMYRDAESYARALGYRFGCSIRLFITIMSASTTLRIWLDLSPARTSIGRRKCDTKPKR